MAASFGSRLNVSLQAVAQVLLVCCLGVWLARRHGFDRKVRLPMWRRMHGLSSPLRGARTHTCCC